MTDQPLLDLRPIFGLEARITASAAATDGAWVEMGCLLRPGGRTGVHYHPQQEETYDVLEGTLEVLADGLWHPVPAGEQFAVPRGAPHAFRNSSKHDVRFVNVHRPAHSFQQHLETLDRLVRTGRITGPKDLRSLLYLCLASVDEAPSVMVKPPQWLLNVMAATARRLGFRLD